MKRVLAAGVALLMSTAVAHAGLEVAGGVTTYRLAPNGTWYQKGNPGHVSPASIYGSIGYAFRAKSALPVHLDVVSLGSIYSDTWDTSDAAYQAGCLGSGCGQWDRFDGSGHTIGVSLTAAPTWRLTDNASIYVEAGAWLYRATWSEHVTAPDGSTYASVHNRQRWHPGFVAGFGASYRFGPVTATLGYRYYTGNNCQSPYPPIWRDAHVVFVQYQF